MAAPRSDGLICIHHVLREQGLEMPTADSVSCGLRIAAEWRKRNGGRYPVMHLHPKEGKGPGYNNYAHYEPEFRPVILALIQEYQAVKRSQGDLF